MSQINPENTISKDILHEPINLSLYTRFTHTLHLHLE